MSRANMLKSSGLVTAGSELIRKEGALEQAINVNVDEDGEITARRGFNDYGNATDLGTLTPVKQLIQYKDRLFRHYSDQIEFEDSEGNFNSIIGSFTEVREGYRIKSQESKGNMYFTTEEGIKRISLKNNSKLTPSGTITIDQAGVPKAAYMEGSATAVVGGFLPAQSKVAYRFIFGKRDANNNLLLGSPSAREIISNTAERTVVAEDASITFSIDAAASATAIVDGDYIVVPTLNTKTTFYFKTTASEVSEPKTADTIGSTYVLVDVAGNSENNTNAAAILANEIASNVSGYTITLSASNVVSLISTEEGDIDDIIVLSTNSGVTSTNTSGSVTEGDAANTDITLVLPSDIDETYFVQVYRTANITAVEGLDLADIDPGDESNLVYETPVTAAAIAAGQIEFTDDTPESFRASNIPLYTNEVTGQGILQSNDPPPIALDMELFRNSMFYANTKSTHRITFDMLSVNDFEIGKTRLIVANSTSSRYYTAEAAELADTTDGGDFKLSTAISVGQSIDETARSIVKVINQDTNSPVNAFYLTGADDLPGQLLFEARDLSDDTFYFAIESGYDAYDGATTYSIDDRVNFSGLDYICIQATTGIDDTSEDPSGTATSNSFWSYINLSEEFNPELPNSKLIERLQGNITNTIITLTDHGYSTGDQVVVNFLSDGDIDAPSSFSGSYEVTVTGANTFTIPVEIANTVDSDGANPFSLFASSIYSTELESDNLEVPNRLYFSKINEPEAVPISNFIDVGAKDEEIQRILALRDNLFVLKSDGIFIVSGTSAPNFSVRLLDNTRIIAPDSAVVLNNQIYALTEQGVTVITDSGAGIISRGIEDLIDEVANSTFDYVPNTFGIPYENDRAYLLFMPSVAGDTSATQAYRYNIFERTWTKWEYSATCGLVADRDIKLYLGNGDRSFISQERKNFNRTDHADRDFTITISADGVEGANIKLSSLADVEVNDVLVQTQEVSINYINNRILKRIDSFDNGLVTPMGSTMLETFGASFGDNMVQIVQNLNDYLVMVDGAVTVKFISPASLKEDMDLIIDQLNSAISTTTIKTYAKPESVDFEAYVTAKDVVNNLVTVHFERPFIQDDIVVYKSIPKVIEWAPQHYGDPSAVKQVREVTILFDQNNYYEGIAKFKSDVEQSFTSVTANGKGIGYWGDMNWGDPNHYWGGDGNDVPCRKIVPRGKQKCRYITILFEHKNAREDFRVLGITANVRAISSRGYK